MRTLACIFSISCLFNQPVFAQRTPVEEKPPAVPKETIDQAVASGAAFLLSRQEGDTKSEWPYEGVYRVDGQIPIGYRVGNTGICIMALLTAPSATEQATVEAIRRAADFICESTKHPLMSEKDYDAGYDVRGWGYIFGMQGLLRAKAAGVIADDRKAAVDESLAWYCDALQKIEIPEAGGWNYARPGGRTVVAPPSSFMTSCALQALMEAKSAGCSVNEEVMNRAISFIMKSKSAIGAVQYSGEAGRRNDQTPGAVGRMLSVETTLQLAGKGEMSDLRGAIDAFITHWEWLDRRRAKRGTHEGPYAIAPYYFMFAHRYAAMAIEMLPRAERAEYRRKVNNLLFSVRAEDGTWNDRVFPRTANYGTAFAMLALTESGKAAPTP